MMTPINLTKDYREFIELLNSHGVEYLVVGAWALGFHAEARYTGDLDVFVRKSAANAQNLMSALNDFGFGKVGLTTEDFQRSNRVVQLGYEPNRIDILTDISGMDFEKAWGNRETVTFKGLDILHISREDLIINKRHTARPKDLLDIKNLENSAPEIDDNEQERER